MSDDQKQADVFDKENTYSGSPRQTIQFLILQYQDIASRNELNYLYAAENSGGRETNMRKWKGALHALYRKLKTRMKKRDGYNGDVRKLINDNPNEAFDLLNEYLEDDLKLTKIDTTKQYDRQNIETENEEKGL